MMGLRWFECDRPVPGQPGFMQRTKVLQCLVRVYEGSNHTMEWIDVPVVREESGDGK